MDKQVKEILCITQEECAEVTQAISKIFRFGADTSWEGQTNLQHLEEELGDLKAMMYILEMSGIVNEENVMKAAEAKTEKLAKWSNINLSVDK
jgi:NTP pyrophosphatase (non-canonical NTP hydrolase)